MQGITLISWNRIIEPKIVNLHFWFILSVFFSKKSFSLIETFEILYIYIKYLYYSYFCLCNYFNIKMRINIKITKLKKKNEFMYIKFSLKYFDNFKKIWLNFWIITVFLSFLFYFIFFSYFKLLFLIANLIPLKHIYNSILLKK